MDSFCDQPRSPLAPTRSEIVQTAPSVPEVSMIFHNAPLSTANTNKGYGNFSGGYNAWKMQNRCLNQRDYIKQNKENVPCCRKQVTFESPVVQQPHEYGNQNHAANQPYRHQVLENGMPNKSNLQNPMLPKSFEQIYMANIPNRHLDLSIVEPPKLNREIDCQQRCNKLLEKDLRSTAMVNQIQKSAKSYKVFRQERCKADSNTNGSIVDVYNYRRNNGIFTSAPQPDTNEVSPVTANFNGNTVDRNNFGNEKYYSRDGFCSRSDVMNKKTDVEPLVNENKGEKQSDPTVRDLLKIIQQQNEQLIILQKQVASLLENKSPSTQIGPCTDNFEEPHVSSTHHESSAILFNKEHNGRKGPLPKFAFDLMTSFEVSIRRQQNFGLRNKFAREVVSHEPKIQEITETESSSENEHVGLSGPGNFLDGISKAQCRNQVYGNSDVSHNFDVQEGYASPENSMRIDMEDYSSDEDESPSSSNIKWTVYNNVLGQVNDILKKSSQPHGNEFAQQNSRDSKIKNKTMKQVREATIKHLKSIGVHVPHVDDTSDVANTDDNKEQTPTQISFAVKQLLMKYLPDEQLARITCTQESRAGPAKEPTNDATNFISKRPDFSFATVEYMKKYNIIAPSDGIQNKKQLNPQEGASAQSGGSQKILDITALKQQPKLM